MQSVTNFIFNTKTIRVVTIKGDPWFVAADVCEVLGFAKNKMNGSYANHLRRLDDDETDVMMLPSTTQSGSQPRRTLIISESGLYKLVLRSDKPEAKPFQDWVTKVVLPAIRKDGMYVMGEEKVPVGEMSEEDPLRRKSHTLEEI